MPRIITIRLFRLWLAVTMNDYGEMGLPRIGLTEDHARRRASRYA